MTSPATRTYVRHAGDVSSDVLTERESKAAERRAELEARIAANPHAAAAAAAVERGRRRR